MTTIPLPAQPHVALRPLALPAEHGGWGILLEPIVLGLLVVASGSGALVAAAAVFAFLSRHPLKLALQDAMRGKRYPRTSYCRALAAAYLIGALVALASAVAIGGGSMSIPLGIAAPFALVQVLYDARNRSRELFPEICGALAMSSVAAAIGIAGEMPIAAAFALTGIIAARSLPAILYVRTLLGRRPAWPVLLAHGLAIAGVARIGSRYAIAAMLLLLLRAIWGVTHERPRAQTIGWREIVFGALTVALVAHTAA